MNQQMNQQEAQMAEKIRSQYTSQAPTALDALKDLDRKVKRPANAVAFTVGTVAALVMGSGMSLVMTDIGGVIGLAEPMVPGICLGFAGMLLALVNYPFFKAILKSRRKKYAPRILELTAQVTGK